jgi:hypothetical protein
MQVGIEVQHLGGTVAEPGQGLAVGHVVIGAQAGEVVAKRMELVSPRALEATCLTMLLEPLEQLPLGDRPEYPPVFIAGGPKN